MDADADAERSRRIEESKEEYSDVNVERRKTYDRLVVVQEDLLKTIQRMKVCVHDCVCVCVCVCVCAHGISL